MQFSNQSREYPDEWQAKLAEHPYAFPIFIHKRIVSQPEEAELKLKGLLAQRAKQTHHDLQALTAVEELVDGWGQLVWAKPKRSW